MLSVNSVYGCKVGLMIVGPGDHSLRNFGFDSCFRQAVKK